MISRRIVVNLVAFLVASTVLIVFGVVNLLGDPFDAPMDVSTVLPSADGLYTHFSVTLNGVDVGSVSSVGLTPAGAKVTMAIDPGVRIPGDVAAEIDVANPLGEQEIDLVPQRGGRGPDRVDLRHEAGRLAADSLRRGERIEAGIAAGAGLFAGREKAGVVGGQRV